MPELPKTKKSLVLRTDFSDDSGWEAVCAAIANPTGKFRVSMEFINDPEFADLTVEQLLALIPPSSKKTFIFLVDAQTISNDKHPVLVVDLFQEGGRTFRALPSDAAGVENNLAIANMDWEDFSMNTDVGGIFRGFSR